MRPTPARIGLLLTTFALAGAVVVGVLVLRTPTAAPLEDIVPEVDADFRRLLVDGGDEDFANGCRTMGEALMTQHWVDLARPALHGDLGAFEELEPHLVRFAAAYGDIYDIRVTDHLLEALRRTPADTLAEANRLAAAMSVVHAGDTPDSTVIATTMAGRAYAQRHGLTWLSILFDARLIRLEVARGRRDLAWRHLETGLTDSRRVDHMLQICQLLGVAYQMHMEEGRPDSAFHYLDLAEARARRSRSPYQTSRILGFRAAEARDQGRISAAHIHLLDAWQASQDYLGGGLAIRTLLNLADMYEDLDCWPARDRMLAAIRTASSLPPRHFDEGSRLHEDMRIRIHDLRSALAHGDSTQALAMMDSVSESFGPRPFAEIHARFHYERAALLFDMGRLDAAAAATDRIIDHAVRDHLPGWVATLRVQQADIALARTDTARALWALSAWRDLDGAGVVAAEQGTSARAAALAARASRGSERVAALRAGLAAFQTAASRGDAGVSSYLRIAAFDELRWFIHELLADDPALGLDFDMRWRRVGRPGAVVPCHTCRSPAGCGCPATTPRDLLEHWSRPGDEPSFSVATRRAASAGDLAHVLYLATPRTVTRWWTDAAGTRRLVLDTSPDALAERIAAVDRSVSLPRDAVEISPPLARDLRELGHLILPKDGARQGLRLLVSTDGALGRLPFGALDLQPAGSYRPLQDDVLLAHLRRAEPARPGKGGSPALVVVCGAPHPGISRRQPDLGGLPGAAREGAAVAKAWSGSRILAGPEATKQAFLDGLDGVARIHLASHLVQDATTPYLSYIPLAAAAGRIEDSMLEPRDILQADLGPCDLVVLSGCSSGVPFVAGTRQAPAFGDVFLDAGASHAVQALWDVDDATTALVMASFARQTSQSGDVWAYAEALRDASALLRWDRDEAPHPFQWAPWFITTTAPGF